MPGYKQHARKGIKVGLFALVPVGVWLAFKAEWDILTLYRVWWKLPICLVLSYLFALFPDTDIKSISQRVIYLIWFVLDAILILYKYYREAALIGLLAMLPQLTKHRGWTHSWMAALIVPTPLLAIPVILTMDLDAIGVSYYTAGVFGYASHLWADRKSGEN